MESGERKRERRSQEDVTYGYGHTLHPSALGVMLTEAVIFHITK